MGGGSEAHLTTQSIAPPPTQPTINISSCPLKLSLPTVVPNGRTECLWQSAVQLYPDAPAGASAICLPIERLPLKDWRSRRVAGTKRGWAPLEKLTVYKLSLCPHLKPFSRLIYIDLGANSYESSIGSWFRVSYPHGDLFDVIAFEPNARFARSYDGKKRLELVQAAAWVANTTVPWSSRRGRSEKSGRIELPSTSAATVTRAVQEGTQSMRAIDIAGMLRQRVRPSDYVVLKVGRPLALELTLELTPREPLFSHTYCASPRPPLSILQADIEGAEYTVVPHLIRSGTLHLVDEMFVEVHTEINTCCRPPHNKGRSFQDAMRLIASLREAGVYAHAWS